MVCCGKWPDRVTKNGNMPLDGQRFRCGEGRGFTRRSTSPSRVERSLTTA
jgi:hypothetical protein